MLLEIYTPALRKVGAIEVFGSLQWTRRYFEAGQFELHLPFDLRLPLVRGNYLVKGDEAAVIEAIALEQDGKSGSALTLRGRMLTSFLSLRVLSGVNSEAASEESVMVALASKCFIGDRAISGMAIAASQNRGAEIDYQCENANLYDELTALSRSSGLGLKTTFTPSSFTLSVYQGLDRTSGQSTNSRAIFSRAYENVLNENYDEDGSEEKNVAVVYGEFNGSELVETVGTATGILRRELILSGGNVSKDEDDNTLTEAQARALLQQKGVEALAEAALEQSFTVTADPNGNLRYKSDYDLGDIVTVECKEWGMAADLRITEVNEIYEAEGFSVELTLGTPFSNLKKKVRMWTNG